MTTKLTDEQIAFVEREAHRGLFGRLASHDAQLLSLVAEVRESRSALSREREARERAEARLKNYEDGQMCCPRAERAEAALRRLLRMVPTAPCPCQDRFPYKPSTLQQHHPTCESVAARAALAGPSGGGET